MSTPEQPTTEDPTCPRHPGVVSYVRCTRCHRPVCGQCQRQAPVGIQCVDCVRTAAKANAGARTSLGAPASGVRGTPATVAIIALCVLVFVAQQIVPGLLADLSFIPADGRDEPWRFLAAAFLHGGVTHILFNMYALWIVGTQLERLMGTPRFTALYLISAVGGSVGYLLLASSSVNPTLDPSPAWTMPTVGASGAVFGLFAAELVVAVKQRRDVTSLLIFLAINGAIGFLVPNIAWQAHLGGFVTGGVIAALVWATRSRERSRLQWPALLGVLAVLVVLSVVKYALSPVGTGWYTG